MKRKRKSQSRNLVKQKFNVVSMVYYEQPYHASKLPIAFSTKPVFQYTREHGDITARDFEEVVEKRQTGVLFRRWQNQEWRWFSNGDMKKDLKYVGEIENGGPNGQGTLTSPEGDKYVGEFKDGYRNG